MQTLRFDQKVSLQEIIIDNEPLCSSFVEYLASIHAIEAFEFWIEVELYKRIVDQEECTRTAKFIFTTYLSPHSPNEINLEGRLRRELLENFSKKPNDPQLFNKAQDSVEMMLKYDCLRVFLEVNKGKVRKSAVEPKPRKDKPEPHALLQRYNSLIKLEKKKVRRESFKKSISGTIRRFTTNTSDQPKSIAATPKSNSFTMDSKLMLAPDTAETDERKSDSDEISPRLTARRARGKKIRLDPNRKWTMAVSDDAATNEAETAEGLKTNDAETPGGSDDETETKGENEADTTEEPKTNEAEIEKNQIPIVPEHSEWVAYEKPSRPVNEIGSTEFLVGAKCDTKALALENDAPVERKEHHKAEPCSEVVPRKDAEKRRSGGGLFTCFGSAKKRP